MITPVVGNVTGVGKVQHRTRCHDRSDSCIDGGSITGDPKAFHLEGGPASQGMIAQTAHIIAERMLELPREPKNWAVA